MKNTVMEERLGRMGRPLTTILIICLALGAIAWGVNQFITNALLPLGRFFEWTVFGEPLLTKSRAGGIVVSVITYCILGVIAHLLVRRFILKPAEKRLERLKKQTGQGEKLAEETNKQTAEMVSKLLEVVDLAQKNTSVSNEVIRQVKEATERLLALKLQDEPTRPSCRPVELPYASPAPMQSKSRRLTVGELIATCGDVIPPEEGVGEAFWLYDGGELMWVSYCRTCKAKLTPVYTYDPMVLARLDEEEADRA